MSAQSTIGVGCSGDRSPCLVTKRARILKEPGILLAVLMGENSPKFQIRAIALYLKKTLKNVMAWLTQWGQ